MTITVAIILFTIALSFLAWRDESLLHKLTHYPFEVKRKNQYYRLLSSGFVHANYMHLAFNMLTLYFFGDLVAYYLGQGQTYGGAFLFLGLYLGGIVVSDLPTLLRHRDHASYHSLGASGGVSSVVFSFIAFEPTQNLCLFFILCLPGFVLGILYLIYSWYMAKNPSDHINHEAHLYGALFGVLYTVYFYPQLISTFFLRLSRLDLLFIN